MKTLILSIMFIGLFACEKEDIKPVKDRFLIKYEVDCSTSGFDLIYTNAILKVEKKIINGMHWDTTFMNISNDTLVLGATPKNVHSKISGKIFYNGIAADSMSMDNSGNTSINVCYIVFNYIIK